MNAKKFLYFLAPITVLSPTNLLFSCTQTKTHLENPRIISPEITEFTSTLSDSKYLSATISNFHFEDISSLSHLTVTSTFKQGGNVLHCEIINFDVVNKTFAIRLFAANVEPDILTGSFVFKYHNRIIPIEEEKLFKINVVSAPIIKQSDITIQKIELSDSTQITLHWNGFTCKNIKNIANDIHVSSTFVQEGAEFTYKIIPGNDDEFEVEIQISNAVAGVISGIFTFEYQGKIFEMDKTCYIILNKNNPLVCLPPPESKRVVVNQDASSCSIQFKNFTYSGIQDLSKLSVIVSSDNSTKTEVFESKIVTPLGVGSNFDVAVTITNIRAIQSLPISFSFVYDGNEIPCYGEQTNELTLDIAFPSDCLMTHYSSDYQGYCVEGFVNHFLPPEGSILLIPSSYAVQIRSKAFSDVHLWIEQRKISIEFEPNSILSKIDDNAFFDDKPCYWLVGNISLPNSVIEIGAKAFSYLKNVGNLSLPNSRLHIAYEAFKSSSISGTLDIPEKVMSIDTSAFEDCANLTKIIINSENTNLASATFGRCTHVNVLDFSHWKSMPDWLTRIEYDNIFENIGSEVISEENKGKIIISRSFSKDEMWQALIQVGFKEADHDKWDIVYQE